MKKTRAQELAKDFYVRCLQDATVAAEKALHEPSEASYRAQDDADRRARAAYFFARDDHGWTPAELIAAVRS